MADIEWMVDEIENGPQGPEIGAFFDFDGTLISGYSAIEFFRARLRHNEIAIRELVTTLVESINVEARGHDVNELMEIAVQAQKGNSVTETMEFGQQIFQKKIAGMIYPDARILVEAHRQAGHTVALASSATPPQVEPAAADLGIDNILCTELDSSGGILTGLVKGPIRWGPEKAAAVVEFADEVGIDLSRSYAYGNGSEDVDFLKTVGYSRPLNPDDELLRIAKKNKWPTANFKMPHRHNPITLARSAVALGALGMGVSIGMGAALINRDRSVGAAVAGSVGTELCLAVAGINLNVVGSQNLWSHRPAVFLFNHQSQLDPIILGTLLRRDFTGVAKKSLEYNPVVGPVGYLADVAFIDRSNTAQAKEALKPVMDALGNGRSIVIAPEGTRSPTPRLLPFKKGGFYMAMQAGVPVVPIVMRNAGDLMRPHSMVMSSGTIDVAVLKPVSTKTWTHDNLGSQVAKVRKMYLNTFAHWPTK